MARKYKFSWDEFENLNHNERHFVLKNYLLTTSDITKNLFELIKTYANIFMTKDIKEVSNNYTFNKKSIFDYNFKRVVSYCKLYNFFKMRD